MGQGDYELSADELDTPKWERERRDCDTGSCPGCQWCAKSERPEPTPELTYLDCLRELRAEAAERKARGEERPNGEDSTIEGYSESIRAWMRGQMFLDRIKRLERRPI